MLQVSSIGAYQPTPFSRTAPSLARACADRGVRYLDLAGEWPEIAATAALDERARASGAMLMPGVGFGVVPTDCLARRVAERLRARGVEPEKLDLVFEARREGPSGRSCGICDGRGRASGVMEGSSSAEPDSVGSRLRREKGPDS